MEGGTLNYKHVPGNMCPVSTHREEAQKLSSPQDHSTLTERERIAPEESSEVVGVEEVVEVAVATPSAKTSLDTDTGNSLNLSSPVSASKCIGLYVCNS